MDCMKCKTRQRMGRQDNIGQLVENIITETDSYRILYATCTICDYRSPMHTKIVGSKRWNQIYEELKPAFIK